MQQVMEYTTVLHLLLSSLFIKDAQEPQLIFKTRASEKPWDRARNSLEEVTNSAMMDRREIHTESPYGISDFCSNYRTLKDPFDLKPISSFSTLLHLWLWSLKAAVNYYIAKEQPRALKTLSRPRAHHTR